MLPFRKKVLKVVCSRPLSAATLCTFLAIAAIHLGTLLRFPPPFIDEAWYTARAWALIQHGVPLSQIDKGILEELDFYWAYFSWSSAALQGIFIFLLGPSLLSTRLVSFLFGLLLLIAVYLIGKSCAGDRVALIAMILCGFSPAFFYSSHIARVDIIVTALGYSAIMFYIASINARSSRSSIVRMLASGLMIGLSIEIHTSVILFSGAIIVLLATDNSTSLIEKWRAFAAFAIGPILGALLFIVLHVLPNPSSFSEITWIIYGSTRTPPVLIPETWKLSLLGTALLIQASVSLQFLWAMASLPFIFRNKFNRETRLLICFPVLLILFILLVPFQPFYYGVLIAPSISLSAAFVIHKCLTLPWKRSAIGYLSRMLPLTTILLFIVSVQGYARTDSFSEFDEILGSIRGIVSRSDRILGEELFWLGLTDYDYTGWIQLAHYQRYCPGSSLSDAFEFFRPDFVLIDENQDWYFSQNTFPGIARHHQYYRMQRTDFDQVITKHGELVYMAKLSFDTIRLYRLAWTLHKDYSLAPPRAACNATGR